MSESSSKSRGFDSQLEQLGAVYAKGLLGAAQAAGRTEPVMEQLQSLVNDVFDALPDLERFLASPRIAVEVKQEALDRALAGKMDPLLLNFLKVVARHLRLDCLRQIERASRDLYNEFMGRVEVEVVTAAPVETPVLGQITDRLTAALGKAVDLQTSVDPELLGGLVVRVGDTVYDGSIANRLVRMRQESLDSAGQLVRESLERFLVSDQ